MILQMKCDACGKTGSSDEIIHDADYDGADFCPCCRLDQQISNLEVKLAKAKNQTAEALQAEAAWTKEIAALKAQRADL